MMGIECQRFFDAVAYLAVLQDVQEQCPILTFADVGHIVFLPQSLSVIDGRQAAYLVVTSHIS